eukprot:13115595-Alexandrium_andersonii.AAC.1
MAPCADEEGRMPRSKHWTPDTPVAHNLPAPAHPYPRKHPAQQPSPQDMSGDERKRGVHAGGGRG